MKVLDLIKDVPEEMKEVVAFIKGVESVVNDAKAQGMTSVTVAALEALIPEGEALATETEKVIGDV